MAKASQLVKFAHTVIKYLKDLGRCEVKFHVIGDYVIGSRHPQTNVGTFVFLLQPQISCSYSEPCSTAGPGHGSLLHCCLLLFINFFRIDLRDYDDGFLIESSVCPLVMFAHGRVRQFMITGSVRALTS